MEQMSLFAAGDTAPALRVYSVSQITARIKGWLDGDRVLQDLWLQAEVSNWKRSAAGHIYFTLKDEAASIRCAMWRSSVLRAAYLPDGDGEAVLAHGYVSVYEPQGQYQYYVDELQPVGLGSLYARFEQLKARLQAEGLFDAARKRPLPAFPRRIGVVTSPSGAALRDILTVLRRRYPLAEVIVAPTLVQGPDAPEQIVHALEGVGQVPGVDAIILARGGGSLEDLWAFNEEAVARAIVAAPVPVVSGVGHETDFTIADFAADVRAPTPSAAAELVAPDRASLRRHVAAAWQQLAAACAGQIEERRRSLHAEVRALRRLSPRGRIDRQRQRVDELTHALARSTGHRLALQRERLHGLQQRLAALNPAATLARGYAIVRRRADGRPVTRVAQVAAGDGLTVQVSDGTFEGVVG
jgi:exodeoxyribonuclease VII large subunit